MAEASPRVAASSQRSFPSSSFRTRQNLTGASPALHDKLVGIQSVSSSETLSTIPRAIPKGVPKADALFGGINRAGNAELSAGIKQQESAVAGFLKFVTEDEDNLDLLRQREEEKQKAEQAQGKLTLFGWYGASTHGRCLIDS